MEESKEELSSLLIKMKEESEKAALKFNVQKPKIMASGPITLWQIDGETKETVTDYFLELYNHCWWNYSEIPTAMKLKDVCALGKKKKKKKKKLWPN